MRCPQAPSRLRAELSGTRDDIAGTPFRVETDKTTRTIEDVEAAVRVSGANRYLRDRLVPDYDARFAVHADRTRVADRGRAVRTGGIGSSALTLCVVEALQPPDSAAVPSPALRQKATMGLTRLS